MCVCVYLYIYICEHTVYTCFREIERERESRERERELERERESPSSANTVALYLNLLPSGTMNKMVYKYVQMRSKVPTVKTASVDLGHATRTQWLGFLSTERDV